MIIYRSLFGKKYGGYQLMRAAGEGRYGKCYIAQSSDGVQVIIKRFRKHIFKKNKDKNAYEAVLLSQIKHEAVPELLGVINDNGFYGFVLEYKKGETIKELLFKQNHKFSMTEIYNIGLQLIRVISYLHKKGIVHRDIRIPNVVINKNEVFLIDFGLARWADDNRYSYDIDFSYLGDFLLYLLYSSYETKLPHKKLPWYKELVLSNKQETFLKKLLRLESPFDSITTIEKDFIEAFGNII